MTSEWRIDLQGEALVLDRLAALQAAIEHPEPAFQAAADELVTLADRRFQTKTDPAGIPWASWRPRTARRRLKEGYNQASNLLEITRGLRLSLHGEGTDEGIVLGMGKSYAPFHETGTRRMARRGILLAQVSPEPALGEPDRRAVLDILGDHLMGAAHG